jgi:hypothetical protein
MPMENIAIRFSPFSHEPTADEDELFMQIEQLDIHDCHRSNEATTSYFRLLYRCG